MRLKNTWSIVALLIFIDSGAILAQPGNILNLGTLGGTDPTSRANAINSLGQVVGWADGFPMSRRAFVHPGINGGTMTNLGLANATDSYSEANAINDNGVIVGISVNSQDRAIAMKHSGLPGGTMTSLGTIGGLAQNQSIARTVNNSGVVYGSSSYDTSSNTHAFRHAGTMSDLLGASGGANSVIFGGNAQGEVVGYASFASGLHAFKHPGTVGGALMDLGTLPGHTGSRADGINVNGVVVGYSSPSGGGPGQAMKHPGTAGGTMIALQSLGGTTSWAHAINATGFIVGHANTPSGQTHATFWRMDNSIVDLDTWLDTVNPVEGAKWTLTWANDMNDSGMVVGYGQYNDGLGGLSDGERAFVLDASALMTPVPEPAIAGFVLVLACILTRKLRAEAVAGF